MVRQGSNAQRKEAYEEVSAKRNPYLVDYEARQVRRTHSASYRSSSRTVSGREMRRTYPESNQREADYRPASNKVGRESRPTARQDEIAYRPVSRQEPIGSRPAPRQERSTPRQPKRQSSQTSYDLTPIRRSAPRQSASRRAAQQRRRKRILMQRMLLGAWAACILLFAVFFAVRGRMASAAEGKRGNDSVLSGELDENLQAKQSSGASTQGIPAEKFATHPEWTEDFLTPNEYSRPGEALEAVNNIFVHYTANPGTSAAQNRSYFEWQKDTHEASVSAHFVIGYEGEIIQCIPLDEIAYAVMTRNYDSISIECCYLETDGSFTQATYDSLVSLLAWLTDVYNLDSEDILRHYDCGGKKCPLYYTENEDAWEQLKKDVDNL